MSQQAEQEVIASLLMDGSLMQQCGLEGHEFQTWHYQEIYSAMQEMAHEGDVIDIVTVAQLLEKRVPGQAFLPLMTEILDNSIGSSKNFGSYIGVIRKDYRLKQVADIAETLRHEVRENKNLAAADEAISQLMALNHVGRKYDWSMRETMHDSVKVIEAAHESDGLVGIPTGLKLINEATGGWHDTDLIIVGARPAMGKTALMLNFAFHANVPAGIISAEQAHEQVGLRFISIQGELDSQKIRTAKFTEGEWSKLTASVKALRDCPIRINDEGNINITRLMRQAREWKHRYGIRILFVDYIQKIEGTNRTHKRTEQVTEVTRALKNLAKELKIPVVALAQVSRDVEKRPDKRPNMGDLSDASEIEKEADLIAMLYRDEVYNEESPDKGIAEINFEKNRHGPIGVIRTVFKGQFMRFEELAPKSYQQYGGAA